MALQSILQYPNQGFALRNTASYWSYLGSVLGRWCPGCFGLGYVQETLSCWWWGQAALWRCNLFHLTPQWTSGGFGSCIFLPSPKWVARSLSLLMNCLKLPLKPLSRGAAPPGTLRLPPHFGGRQEMRGNYLSLSPSPPRQVCWGLMGRAWMVWHQSPQAQLLQSLAQGWEQWPWLEIQTGWALVPAAAILVPSLGIWK